jgi:hypothetical protein
MLNGSLQIFFFTAMLFAVDFTADSDPQLTVARSYVMDEEVTIPCLLL